MKTNIISALVGVAIGLALVSPNLIKYISEENKKVEEPKIYVLEAEDHEAENQEAAEKKKIDEVRNVELLSCVEPAKAYTEEELELLAHLIMAETGSDWLPDEMLYMTGSVVLNRVASDRFPNTIAEVIYQKGQYSSSVDYVDPTDRCYRIAKELLENGSVIPENVVFQAEFIQGSKVYAKIGNTYYCEL